MNKKILIGSISVVLTLIVAYFLIRPAAKSSDAEIIAEAKKGLFQVEISTSGELEAKNSVRIMGPNGLRAARIWDVKIDAIVPEGTVVKKGDFIASLDKSQLSDRLRTVSSEYDQNLSQFTQTKLDTALELRSTRDELVNLQFAMEEAILVLEQSQFEPPAAIKKAEIDVERAKRTLNQARESYQLKIQKAQAQMQEAGAKLADAKRELEFLENLMLDFDIKAPEAGMVIYEREWNGKKRGQGSQIGAWDPTVATLPDLSKMLSRTYVNEVDIRKIQVGQYVKIGLDAFPEKKLTGKVQKVANVGEQRPNSEAKVFEVSIEINEMDTTLRPSMTTSNAIIAEVIPDVIFVPLECLHSQGDTLTFVFKKEGLNIKKQQVIVGKSNSNEAVIELGIQEGERLLLSLPTNHEKLPLSLLDETLAPLSATRQ